MPTEFNDIFDVYHEFLQYVHKYRVYPKSVINYRRGVYQEDEHELRITFDDQIAVFNPIPGVYNEVETMARSSLGEPVREFSYVTMEIKSQDGYPRWLAELLSTHRAERISKFTSSLNVITQELPRRSPRLVTLSSC